MSVLTCRTGLSLYSRPINQFFKRSIKLWNEWFDHWIFDSSFNFDWNGFTITLNFFFHIYIFDRFGSWLIVWYVSMYTYVLDILYRAVLSVISIEEFQLPTQRSQLHSLEQLPLSLCTYPFLIFTFWTLICFRKEGFGSGLPIVNSRVSLNLKVFTW